MFMKKLFIFLLTILLLTGCQKDDSSEQIDGNVLPPSIYINGSLYGVHPSKTNEQQLDERFSYYGTVQSVVENQLDLPKEELQVSDSLDHCIGYKVYISDDKDLVAIFIETLNEYAFFD